MKIGAVFRSCSEIIWPLDLPCLRALRRVAVLSYHKRPLRSTLPHGIVLPRGPELEDAATLLTLFPRRGRPPPLSPLLLRLPHRTAPVIRSPQPAPSPHPIDRPGFLDTEANGATATSDRDSESPSSGRRGTAGPTPVGPSTDGSPRTGSGCPHRGLRSSAPGPPSAMPAPYGGPVSRAAGQRPA